MSSWFAGVGIPLPTIYGAQGIIFVFILQFFPFVFLLVTSGLRTIDQTVEDAARNLGSSELRSFFTVLAPILLLGIGAWALRFALFSGFASNSDALWMLFLGICIHGMCYDFIFVMGRMYVDKHASEDIRARQSSNSTWFSSFLNQPFPSLRFGQRVRNTLLWTATPRTT